MGKIKAYAGYAILILIILSMAYGWYREYSNAQFVAPPSPEIKVEYREGPERIVYLNRPELERKDLLPESVKRDKDKEVTAVTTVPEHDGDTTVIAVIDTDTGETTLETRRERPSFFELSNIKTIGLRYDINRRGTLYGSYEFLRAGKLHMEVYAEINSENRAYAGIGVKYKF
jgi:hypothetical protein